MAIQKNQIVHAPKGDSARNLIIAALVLASFFGAYRFAVASSSGAAASASANVASTAGAGASAGAAAGGGCCGGGGAPVEGSATVEGGVQKLTVDVAGGYNPNVIKLKAGVPTEITFAQSNGCTAVVQSSDLGFQEDLTTGPKTVKIKALQPGTYGFACGMNMVQGQIVVQ